MVPTVVGQGHQAVCGGVIEYLPIVIRRLKGEGRGRGGEGIGVEGRGGEREVRGRKDAVVVKTKVRQKCECSEKFVCMSVGPFMCVSNLSSLLISEPEDRLANDTSALLSLYHLREEEGQPVRADPHVRTDVHSARLK